VARGKVLEANIKSSKEIVERLSEVLASVREAWKVAERETAGQPGMELAPEAPRMTPTVAAAAQPENERSNSQWSA
jgi:hypothetical protein